MAAAPDSVAGVVRSLRRAFDYDNFDLVNLVQLNLQRLPCHVDYWSAWSKREVEAVARPATVADLDDKYYLTLAA